MEYKNGEYLIHVGRHTKFKPNEILKIICGFDFCDNKHLCLESMREFYEGHDGKSYIPYELRANYGHRWNVQNNHRITSDFNKIKTNIKWVIR